MVATELWGRIEASIDLPPLPRTAARLRTLYAQKEPDVGAVGRIVEEDPSLAAKVLAHANSAYFGLADEVRSITRATVTLGLDCVYNLVLQIEVFDRYVDAHDSELELDELWRHSVLAAQLCRDLHPRARAIDPDTLAADELYTCGLLHDLGRVSMAFSLGPEYVQVLRRGRGAGMPTHHYERETFGYTHTEVGAMIAQLWGLPRVIADAIENHHLPRVRLRGQTSTIVVALSDEVSHAVTTDREIDAMHYSTNPLFGYLDLSFEATTELVERARGYLAVLVG